MDETGRQTLIRGVYTLTNAAEFAEQAKNLFAKGQLGHGVPNFVDRARTICELIDGLQRDVCEATGEPYVTAATT